MKPIAIPADRHLVSHEPLARRLRVAIFRRRIDRRLAAGADPADSKALALRARQLTSRTERERLATSIDQLVEAAERLRLRPRAQPSQASIGAARSGLQRISEILRSPSLVYARGIALGYTLVHGDESPLYNEAESGSAWYWAHLAVQALEGHI